MITTLTLNPSLDRTLSVPHVERGAVIRANAERHDPGGKGVNVARALLANGVHARAVLPVGGVNGSELIALLKLEAVSFEPIDVAGATRSNISLVEPDGVVTKVNADGAALSDDEVQALVGAALASSQPGEWIVVSGSVPSGNDPDLYGSLVGRFIAAGRRVAVDTSGRALLSALSAGPTLVKPNREELAEAVGRALLTVGDVVAAGHEVRALGAHAVLASLGADGVVYVDGEREFLASAPVEVVRSAVGAGDCLLAGFLSVEGDLEQQLGQAVGWAAAAVETPGSGAPLPDLIATKHSFISALPDQSVWLDAG